MARYLHDKVPGIEIPDTLFQALADADNIAETAIDIAAHTIREIRPLCQGLHLMAIGWETHIPAIMQRAAL